MYIHQEVKKMNFVNIDTGIIKTGCETLKIGFEEVHELITTKVEINGLEQSWMIDLENAVEKSIQLSTNLLLLL